MYTFTLPPVSYTINVLDPVISFFSVYGSPKPHIRYNMTEHYKVDVDCCGIIGTLDLKGLLMIL